MIPYLGVFMCTNEHSVTRSISCCMLNPSLTPKASLEKPVHADYEHGLSVIVPCHQPFCQCGAFLPCSTSRLGLKSFEAVTKVGDHAELHSFSTVYGSSTPRSLGGAFLFMLATTQLSAQVEKICLRKLVSKNHWSLMIKMDAFAYDTVVISIHSNYGDM